MKKLLISIGVFVFAITNAFAGDALTEDQAKRFVESLDSVNGFGDELEASGKTDRLAIDTQPKAGEKFMPYTKAISALKTNYPADYGRFAQLIKPHGFNADEWSGVGDRVMIAYLALHMQQEDPQAMAMLKQMDRSMLDNLPPELKSQMEASLVLVEAVQNAPQADMKVVSTVKAELDAYMEKQQKQ
ncbi:hypothetical protein ABFZ85_10725 [Hyphococcus formosus]|uniref:hypothetical protein n=1 Tax=Hyphococcus formosus TaxID=3143534 RepID=UPI00398AD2C1